MCILYELNLIDWVEGIGSYFSFEVKMFLIVVLFELDVVKEVSEIDGYVEMDFLMFNGIFILYRVDFYDLVENLKLVNI